MMAMRARMTSSKRRRVRKEACVGEVVVDPQVVGVLALRIAQEGARGRGIPRVGERAFPMAARVRAGISRPLGHRLFGQGAQLQQILFAHGLAQLPSVQSRDRADRRGVSGVSILPGRA